MLRSFTRAGIAQRCVETAEELQKLVMRDMADNESREEQSQELQGYEAIARTQRGPNRPKKLREESKWRSTHIEKSGISYFEKKIRVRAVLGTRT